MNAGFPLAPSPGAAFIGFRVDQKPLAMDRHLSPAETAKRFGISIKALGLPLTRIGQSRALVLVRMARAKLAAGQALSIDDLATLTKETVMTRFSVKEMNQLLTPFADRNISIEDKEALKAKVPDRAQMPRMWTG